MAVRDVVNLLRGSVSLEVTGEFPERFLNLCAQRGSAFWGVDWPDSHTLRLTVAWQDRVGLEELAERTGCVIAQGGKRGLPPFLTRFKKRYALLAGLTAALLAFCLLGRVVMVVEVEGNERVPSAVILTELRRLGLRPGAYGPGLSVRDISNEALLRMEDLSWMAVNLHGIRAQVLVREKIPKPELLDETILGDIVAEAPGIVTRVETWAGDPAVEEGDTVLAGEVLIRGSVRMDPPQYSEREPLWMAVRAMGRVEGRTWRILTASIPLTAEVKAPTGEEKTFWSATILGQRVNFYQNSGIPFDRYDKISKTWNVRLPGGSLPFTLRREICQGWETAETSIDLQAAQAMLEQQLLRRLQDQLGQTGTVVSHSFSAQETGEGLKVTLTAECEEELGRFIPAA